MTIISLILIIDFLFISYLVTRLSIITYKLVQSLQDEVKFTLKYPKLVHKLKEKYQHLENEKSIVRLYSKHIRKELILLAVLLLLIILKYELYVSGVI